MNTVDKLRRVLDEAQRTSGLSKNRAAGIYLAIAHDHNVEDLLEVLAFALVECAATETAMEIAKIRVEWQQTLLGVPTPIERKPS